MYGRLLEPELGRSEAGTSGSRNRLLNEGNCHRLLLVFVLRTSSRRCR